MERLGPKNSWLMTYRWSNGNCYRNSHLELYESLLVHINTHKRASTTEETQNNQVGRITQPVDVQLASVISHLVNDMIDLRGQSGVCGQDGYAWVP